MSSDLMQTRAERVYHLAREKILSGEYGPGDRLILRALARDMGTSMIPVRDALAKLEQEGLVEGVAGRGWRVSDFTPERLSDLATLREALECQVARLCTTRATNEELDELRFLSRQVDRAKGRDTSSKLEERFHLRLVEIARSSAIKEAIIKTNVLWLTFGRPDPSMEKGRRHERLVRAIFSRDPDAAEREMREHVKPKRRTMK